MAARATPSAVGATAELAVASALVRAGQAVYLPFFAAHSRVDLVRENDQGELLRVQCKTSRLHDGALLFRVCSNTGNVPKHYQDEVDEFGVYSPDLGQVYLVPIDHVPTRLGTLRVEPSKNGQRTRVRWASDYLLGPP